MKTKYDVFTDIFYKMANRDIGGCCSDYTTPNTPELFDMIELAGMRNLNLHSLEEFRNHEEYEYYKPRISKDGKHIYTEDFVIVECLCEECIQKGIINR